MPRLLFPLINLALMIYCLIDCIQTDTPRVRNLPKTLWVLLIVILPLAGGVAWLVAGRPPRQPREPGRPRSQAPRGPDDDPDFLRGLGDATPGGPQDGPPPAR